MRSFIRTLKAPYFLFGAGRHSASLMDLIVSSSLNRPDAILDVSPANTAIRCIPCLKPEAGVFPAGPCTVVLSSDMRTTRDAMRSAIDKMNLVPDVHVMDPYEGLPDGPYVK